MMSSPVVAATVDKLTEVSLAWNQRQAWIEAAQRDIEAWKAEQEAFSQQAQLCYGTAQLFGFDLNAAYNLRHALAQMDAADLGGAARVGISDPPRPKLEMSISEFILSEARMAYPNPVRASDLRRKLTDDFGMTVHEKTVGMSLYRLSQRNPALMRRTGKLDWYYVVPADFREVESPPSIQDEEGLF
jgi:hypothetical protein